MTIIQRFFEQFVQEKGKITLRKLGVGLLLSALSGILLGLSFPLTDIFPLAWIGFVPLLIAFRGVSGKRGWAYALFAGLVFWLFIAFWMKTFHPLSLFTAIPALALYFSIPFLGYLLVIRLIGDRARLVRPLVFAFLWVAVEYFRSTGFLGYSWGVMGYSQYLFLPIVQIADIAGVWGVSFLILFFNVSIAEFLLLCIEKKVSLRKAARFFIAPVLLLVVIFVYGMVRLAEDKPQENYRVALVQAFTDPATDWASRYISLQTMDKIVHVTSSVTNQEVDLIIWSETLMAKPAMYFYNYLSNAPKDSMYRKMGEWFIGMAKRMNHDMLLTAPNRVLRRVWDKSGKYRKKMFSYNSAFFFEKNGTFKGEYRKIWLVPFGEWFPFKDTFPWIAKILEKTIASNFTPGEKYTVFVSKKAKFGVVICFEDIFGDLCRRFILAGADFLINTTNDYWSRSVQSQEQHFAISVLRAIENRRYLVRAANTGVTCIVDAWGRVVSRLPNHKIATLVGDISLMRGYGLTLYTRYGDWLGQLGLLVFVLLLLSGLGHAGYLLGKKVHKRFLKG